MDATSKLAPRLNMVLMISGLELALTAKYGWTSGKFFPEFLKIIPQNFVVNHKQRRAVFRGDF